MGAVLAYGFSVLWLLGGDFGLKSEKVKIVKFDILCSDIGSMILSELFSQMTCKVTFLM